MIDELMKMYAHLPKSEQLKACQDDLLAGAQEGWVIAFLDSVDEIRYKHISHVSMDECDMALTPKQLEQAQAETRARVAGDWN